LETFEFGLLFGGRVIADRLVVDRTVPQVRPMRLGHSDPMSICPEPPLEHPLGLVLLPRNEPDDVLVQTGWDDVGLDIGNEAVLVWLQDLSFDTAGHECSSTGWIRAVAGKLTAYSQALQPCVI